MAEPHAQAPGQIRYLDTSPDEDNERGASSSRSARSKSDYVSDSSMPEQSHQGVFAVIAENFAKTRIEALQTKCSTASKTLQTSQYDSSQKVNEDHEMPHPQPHDSIQTDKDNDVAVDDNFALFGLDRGIEVVNLDPDSDSAGEESRLSDSDSSAASQTVADFAMKLKMNKARKRFTGHLSSIDKGDPLAGDSSDDSDQHHIMSNYELGASSFSNPSRASGMRRSIQGNGARSSKIHVLTPEEKRRRREEAVKRREEQQLSACTFRQRAKPIAFSLLSVVTCRPCPRRPYAVSEESAKILQNRWCPPFPSPLLRPCPTAFRRRQQRQQPQEAAADHRRGRGAAGRAGAVAGDGEADPEDGAAGTHRGPPARPPPRH